LVQTIPTAAVLDVSREEKRAGFDYQHPKADVLSVAIELIGDVTAEHAGPDHDDIERIAAVVAHVGPGAGNPAAERIVGEFGLLNIDLNFWIWVEVR
jgi:hypothetical protein